MDHTGIDRVFGKLRMNNRNLRIDLVWIEIDLGNDRYVMTIYSKFGKRI